MRWTAPFQSTPPPRGGRRFPALHTPGKTLFQSTPPARGATVAIPISRRPHRFQSTPPAKGATLAGFAPCVCVVISIHAPREGGDSGERVRHAGSVYFNPRPPRGGRRLAPSPASAPKRFQSTPPREGGDDCVRSTSFSTGDFNPRPPARGATQRKPAAGVSAAFQSTPPRKGGDADGDRQHHRKSISIHAPPRGGRPQLSATFIKIVDISIHAPPRGGRPSRDPAPSCHTGFQSTPPREGGDSPKG